jgi:hypothetical protein
MANYKELEFSGAYPIIPTIEGGELDLSTAGSEEIFVEARAQDPNPYLNHVGWGRKVVEAAEEILREDQSNKERE